jgi:hypothetical protein
MLICDKFIFYIFMNILIFLLDKKLSGTKISYFLIKIRFKYLDQILQKDVIVKHTKAPKIHYEFKLDDWVKDPVSVSDEENKDDDYHDDEFDEARRKQQIRKKRKVVQPKISRRMTLRGETAPPEEEEYFDEFEVEEKENVEEENEYEGKNNKDEESYVDDESDYKDRRMYVKRKDREKEERRKMNKKNGKKGYGGTKIWEDSDDEEVVKPLQDEEVVCVDERLKAQKQAKQFLNDGVSSLISSIYSSSLLSSKDSHNSFFRSPYLENLSGKMSLYKYLFFFDPTSGLSISKSSSSELPSAFSETSLPPSACLSAPSSSSTSSTTTSSSRASSSSSSLSPTSSSLTSSDNPSSTSQPIPTSPVFTYTTSSERLQSMLDFSLPQSKSFTFHQTLTLSPSLPSTASDTSSQPVQNGKESSASVLFSCEQTESSKEKLLERVHWHDLPFYEKGKNINGGGNGGKGGGGSLSVAQRLDNLDKDYMFFVGGVSLKLYSCYYHFCFYV